MKAETANAILCTQSYPNRCFTMYPNTLTLQKQVPLQGNNSIKHIISTFFQNFDDIKLKCTMREQELLTSHKSCNFSTRAFIIVTSSSDVTTQVLPMLKQKHTNLHILHQCINLDQEYSTVFEHYAKELNTGADGPSHHKMTENVPQHALSNCYVYAISKLNHDNSFNFLPVMSLVKVE